ncbi:hypothetical protein Glove_33g237 [Diversispora epigaea]|uniref:Uncharacterized protein n=1 Tax=Diversispora epigaea TaxID=1348612 RepID=A0A397JQR2_9GLOM|nr:hypothetical protein Glove_33g237 [Diversispora epigaea]
MIISDTESENSQKNIEHNEPSVSRETSNSNLTEVSNNKLTVINNNDNNSNNANNKRKASIYQAYNGIFAFTSMGVKFDENFANDKEGIYTFRIQGGIYHSIRSLFLVDESPKFLQLYIYDTEFEMENRPNIMTSLGSFAVLKKWSEKYSTKFNYHIPKLKCFTDHFNKSYKAAKDSSTSTLRSHISREHKNLNPEISTSEPLDKFFKSKTVSACINFFNTILTVQLYQFRS